MKRFTAVTALAALLLVAPTAGGQEAPRRAVVASVPADALTARPIAAPAVFFGSIGIPNVITWNCTNATCGFTWGTLSSITSAQPYVSYNAAASTGLLFNTPSGKDYSFRVGGTLTAFLDSSGHFATGAISADVSPYYGFFKSSQSGTGSSTNDNLELDSSQATPRRVGVTLGGNNDVGIGGFSQHAVQVVSNNGNVAASECLTLDPTALAFTFRPSNGAGGCAGTVTAQIDTNGVRADVIQTYTAAGNLVVKNQGGTALLTLNNGGGVVMNAASLDYSVSVTGQIRRTDVTTNFLTLGGTSSTTLQSDVANASGAVAQIINNASSFGSQASGPFLLSVRNGGTEGIALGLANSTVGAGPAIYMTQGAAWGNSSSYIVPNGGLTISPTGGARKSLTISSTNAPDLVLGSNVTDGAAAVGFVFAVTNNLSTAGALVAEFRNNSSTHVFSLAPNGSAQFGTNSTISGSTNNGNLTVQAGAANSGSGALTLVGGSAAATPIFIMIGSTQVGSWTTANLTLGAAVDLDAQGGDVYRSTTGDLNVGCTSANCALALQAGSAGGVRTTYANVTLNGIALANVAADGGFTVDSNNYLKATSGLLVGGGTAVVKFGHYTSASINFGSQTITCEDSTTQTALSVAAGDACVVSGVGSSHGTNAEFSCYSTSAGYVVRFCPVGTAENPPDQTYTVSTIEY